MAEIANEVERLSAYIRAKSHPLHHASPFVIEDALKAVGLKLVPETDESSDGEQR